MTMNVPELIVALDVGSLHEAETLLVALKDTVRFYKVGLRLFTAHGKRAVDLVRRHGGEVFLDLKLHDIPQTVEHAVEEVRRLGAYSLSLHLSGGAAMLDAAAAVHPRPKLWGVSVLTSLGPEDLHALHPRASVEPMVLRLAKLGLPVVHDLPGQPGRFNLRADPRRNRQGVRRGQTGGPPPGRR